MLMPQGYLFFFHYPLLELMDRNATAFLTVKKSLKKDKDNMGEIIMERRGVTPNKTSCGTARRPAT